MARYAIVFIVLLAFLTNFTYLPRGAEAFDCMTLTPNSPQSEKDFCRAELAQIETQLAQLLIEQKAQQKQTGTLTGDVKYLNSQIKALQTKVKARSLKITQLKVDISTKITKIGSLSEKIEREHESLAQLIRNTNEFDNGNLVHLVLSDASLSNFYNDLESYSSIKEAVKASVDQIRGMRTETEAEKKSLELKQDEETDAKTELEISQKKVAQSEAEKKRLLSLSKNKEAEYQKLAAEKKARADKIRSALFSLAGTSQKIPFGTALQYANEAKALTGVDPAFLLAVITQESNLGSNVGRCYLVATSGEQAGYSINISTGKTWTNGMKPSRDIQPFLDITGRLNLDPLKTTVSCPIAGVAGYGGAIGPAQFIPSTWKIFENRLQSVLGYPANPWSPKDAFTASAMYLTDLGAIGNSVTAQHRAACKYYGSGGTSCSYSRSVISLKDRIQADIDVLQ
ncbi:MAG: hypothetical protein WD991_00930 [Candidatus Paceibacterota bacterium]